MPIQIPQRGAGFPGLLAVFCLVMCLQALARAEISQANRDLSQQVFARLLTVTPAQKDIPWPPVLEIVDKDEINAYATIRKQGEASQSVVVCFSGLLNQVIEGDADRLAYVLGHELGHHVLGHTAKSAAATEFLRVTFTREQELAADRKGMELALRANYSYKSGLLAIRRMIDLGLNYSSFEGLGADHPSWLDRIAQLDKEQAGLWRSMSSFDNGVYFLLVQDYPLAERAFRQVTRDFPGSHEAWANLGYAMLMQYADALNTEDLSRFDVGQIVTGGFYRRPKSLEGKVRGINEELWMEAVRALQEAIKLNPGLALPRANLGVAYLFRPAGKDAAKAVQLLAEAVQLAEKDESMDPVSRLATELNLAVAYGAQGNSEKAMAVLTNVETALKGKDPRALRGVAAVSSALAYNRGLLLSRSPDGERQRLAIGELEDYLRHTGPSLAWWQLAYQRYTGLCKQSGVQAKAESALLAQSSMRFRPVAGLEISHKQIVLGQSMAEVKGQLEVRGSGVPVVRGSNLMEMEAPSQGVRVLGGEEVLAIILSGDKAPALPVRKMGLGAKSAELKIGMTSAELDEVLGDSDYDFRQLVDPELNYRFYSDLGVAVLTRSGRVIEMVIGQVPKRKVGI